ncbi:hypothetical protein HRI_005154400 [Hibiscus trionum]|uniref:Uncharacterized protein n=1 Tax=Hibiscus trionum TaxID=183268 RepID=A0A9W7JKD0_HIBTR|nr:hypothetical protein HRI_005154400 [Hibiscus trionum]
MCLVVLNSIFEVDELTAFRDLTIFIFDDTGFGVVEPSSLTINAQKQNRPLSTKRLPFLVLHELSGDG